LPLTVNSQPATASKVAVIASLAEDSAPAREERMPKKKVSDSKSNARIEAAPKYRAPALEKGLDVLELLAAEKAPMTLSAISERLGRSAGELFRMLQVLEYKHFIKQAPGTAGYVLTNKLFALSMAQAPIRSLLDVALPVMRRLSMTIDQSCHIAVASEDQIVVIARVERPGDLGFSVRVGYRRDITKAASGLVLFAYQADEVRRLWLKNCRLRGPAADEFVARADAVKVRGHHQEPSHFVQGIVDLSAPIIRGGSAIAALTSPFVQSVPLSVPREKAISHIREAADYISRELAVGDYY
jgi:DNA-binding IclR family transcriptional regulator